MVNKGRFGKGPRTALPIDGFRSGREYELLEFDSSQFIARMGSRVAVSVIPLMLISLIYHRGYSILAGVSIVK